MGGHAGKDISVREKNNWKGGRRKFARILFYLPEYDRFGWQISRCKFIKLDN